MPPDALQPSWRLAQESNGVESHAGKKLQSDVEKVTTDDVQREL